MSAVLATVVVAAASAAVPLAVRSAIGAGHRAMVRARIQVDRARPGAGGSAPPSWLADARRQVQLLAARVTGRDRRVRAEAAGPFLASIAQQLRSGRTISQAIADTAADVATSPGHRGALAEDLARLEAGSVDGMTAAVQRWAAERADEPLVRAAAAALGVALETGGPALAAVDVAESAIRDREALAGEVRALTAQARASAAVIGVAPLVMAVLTAVADPAAGRFLLTTIPGLGLLGVGLALDLAGVLWMAALLRRFRS